MKYIQTILPSEVYTSLGARDPPPYSSLTVAPLGAAKYCWPFSGGANPTILRPRLLQRSKSEIESWWE